jgi:acetyl-CoA carboxylase biotin carboxyl carrier protein
MAKQKPAIDEDLIRQLARLLEENKLSEIEVEDEGVRIRVARGVSGAGPTASAAPMSSSTSAPVAMSAAASIDPAKHPGIVTSPMVGTAYLGPEPGARPFVDVGSEVQSGQTLLIVEAMKTMNQIPAPHAGKVVQILIADGQPVEFGEPLMIVE